MQLEHDACQAGVIVKWSSEDRVKVQELVVSGLPVSVGLVEELIKSLDHPRHTVQSATRYRNRVKQEEPARQVERKRKCCLVFVPYHRLEYVVREVGKVPAQSDMNIEHGKHDLFLYFQEDDTVAMQNSQDLLVFHKSTTANIFPAERH